jgi:hypothetical protein
LIEKLQKKLVKFMFHKNLNYPTPEEFDYDFRDVVEYLELAHWKKGDLKFLVRSVKNEVDTQSFMHNLNFSVPIEPPDKWNILSHTDSEQKFSNGFLFDFGEKQTFKLLLGQTFIIAFQKSY